MKPTYEELEQQRNELSAQVERLREQIKPAVRLMRATGEGSGWYEKAECIEEMLSETPPDSLSALKAQLQAEALEDAAQLCDKEASGYHRTMDILSETSSDMKLSAECCAEAIRLYANQRAQEAGDE